jgi:hypothetical protein
MKVGGVIITHGRVATELVAAAETVVGDISHIVAVSIGWHDDVEAAQDEIERAIKNVSSGRGVIVMTDMFGGTPTNISAMFLKEGEVEIVTGVKPSDGHKARIEQQGDLTLRPRTRNRGSGKTVYLPDECVARATDEKACLRGA